MASDGKTEYTSKEVQSWIGGGETKVVAQSSASLTYGAKTDISVSVSSSIAVGVKTALSLGIGLEVSYSMSYAIKKDLFLTFAKDNNAFYTDSSVIAVGEADPLAKGKQNTLKIATWILIVAQSASAIAFATIAVEQLHHKNQLDKKNKELADQGKEQVKDTGFYRTFPLGYISSCIAIATSLSAFLVLLVVRLKKSNEQASPNAVLSLDKTSSAFLGIQPFGTRATAGATFNAEGVELSASKRNMGFIKAPGAPSILGFRNKPSGAQSVRGARLKLGADGNINTWGKDLSLQATGPATYQAASHTLDIAGAQPNNRLLLNKNVARLRVNDDAFVSVKGAGEVHAKGGSTSFVKLKGKSAVLSSNGAEVTLSAKAASLAYGKTKVEIDATGIKIGGGALTIFAPGGPITSSELASIIADTTKLKAEVLKAEQALKLAATQQAATDKALETLNESLVAVRAQVDNVSSSSGQAQK